MKKVAFITSIMGVIALMSSCKHECVCDVYWTNRDAGIYHEYLTSETEPGKYTKSECSVIGGTDKDEYGNTYYADCYTE